MPKKLPVYLTLDELRLLLSQPYRSNVQHIIIMHIMGRCGLRVSEAVNLQPKDFEKQPRIAILTVRDGKGGKDRVVPCPLDLWSMVDDYVTHHKIGYDDYLFPGIDSPHYTEDAARKMVKRYGRRAGIQKDIHPHTLRHTFAVSQIKAGVNIINVMKMLGHEHLSTTQIYLQMTQEDTIEDFLKHPVVI
ncbi:MAG: tyrosine-type recombinase/integrase [Bacteroidales bacterium]|nr:tyrosine-type recombinase/integrase [Bacteroidales bacterium]